MPWHGLHSDAPSLYTHAILLSSEISHDWSLQKVAWESLWGRLGKVSYNADRTKQVCNNGQQVLGLIRPRAVYGSVYGGVG